MRHPSPIRQHPKRGNDSQGGGGGGGRGVEMKSVKFKEFLTILRVRATCPASPLKVASEGAKFLKGSCDSQELAVVELALVCQLSPPRYGAALEYGIPNQTSLKLQLLE